MKLSNKARYGLQAMFDLAFHGNGAAVQVKDISARQCIPPRFLEQVFQDLRKAGLVRSKRGPKGGYQLACEPAQIRLGDVIRAAQGPVSLVPEALDSNAQATTSIQVMQHVLRDMGEQIDACLDAVNLESMCDQAREQGLDTPPSAPYVYSI